MAWIACRRGISWLLLACLSAPAAATPASTGERVPLAVVGDSDSHSYQDRLSFPEGTAKRGGRYRWATLQWDEVLARLRGRQLDLGPWGEYGTSARVAGLGYRLGLHLRAPRKQDYRNNFAVSGQGCGGLMAGYRQVPALIALMDEDPAAWRNGIVVIRIGVNDFGLAGQLDALARDPAAPRVQALVAACVRAIGASISAIHAHHPTTRIVLVGIFDNAHWPRYLGRWHSPRQLANIERGLDAFDHALLHMAQADPRVAFFDDRAWFAARWGGRGPDGRPAYRAVTLGRLRVENREGDTPDYAVLADGHAGLAWNALWAQSLVVLLNARFHLGIAPIRNEEIAALPPPAYR